MIKMKYKLAFVKECNSEGLWHRNEIIALMRKHDMHLSDIRKIERARRVQWFPEEIFDTLEDVT